MPVMDSSRIQRRVQRRLYHSSELASLNSPSLPLTEASVKYFQDSFPGSEGLGRLDMPMAATINKRNHVSPCSMVMSMMYAKRLRQRSKQYLQAMSSTDVFFISMMMASKYLYDEGVDEEVYNDEWADSVGHDTEDVNQMEMDFLKEMDWQLFVKPEDFDTTLTAIERHLALKEGMKRGWFTYTEIAVLLDWDPVYKLWNQVGLDCTKVVSLLSTVYIASLVSMMGSAAIAFQLSGPMATATVAVLSLYTSQPMVNNPATVQLPCQSSKVTGILSEEEVNNSLPFQMQLGFSEDARFSDRAFPETGITGDEGSTARVYAGEMKMRENFEYYQTLKSKKSVNEEKDASEIVSLPNREQLNSSSYKNVQDSGDAGKVKQASVLSLWLLDSLLSQVLSVFGNNQRVGTKDKQPCKPCSHSQRPLNHGNEKSFPSRCKRCQSRRCRSKCQSLSSDFRPTDFVSFDEPMGPVSDHAQLATSISPHGSEDLILISSDGRISHPGCKERLIGAEIQLSPASTKSDDAHNSYRGSKHHRFHGKVNKDLEHVNPMSLMAEVPILDPVGFFTRNTKPVYVLGT